MLSFLQPVKMNTPEMNRIKINDIRLLVSGDPEKYRNKYLDTLNTRMY